MDVEAAHADVLPAGAVLLADGREVGRVTSAAWSPRLEHGVALGYVHRDAAEVGRYLTVKAETGDVSATIVALAG